MIYRKFKQTILYGIKRFNINLGHCVETDVRNNTKLFSNFSLLIDMTFIVARGSTTSQNIAMYDIGSIFYIPNCFEIKFKIWCVQLILHE